MLIVARFTPITSVDISRKFQIVHCKLEAFSTSCY